MTSKEIFEAWYHPNFFVDPKTLAWEAWKQSRKALADEQAQEVESHEIIKMAESCGMVIAVPAVGGLSAIWHGVSTLALGFFWNKAKESERLLLMQIFTDPENQPTQFGTVTIDYVQDREQAQAVKPVATVQCINGVTVGYLDVMQPVGTKLYTHPTPPAKQAQAVEPVPEADFGNTERAGFEAWAKREGLNIQRAESKSIPSSRFGLCPATYYFDEAECAWRAWANKSVAQQVAVPAGMALVPIEPTDEDLAKGVRAMRLFVTKNSLIDFSLGYKAMLAAAQGAKP